MTRPKRGQGYHCEYGLSEPAEEINCRHEERRRVPCNTTKFPQLINLTGLE